MKRKMITITLLALLVLLLSAGGVSGQGPEPEGEVELEEDVYAAAKVGSLISYQGRLTEGGSPVTGLRNMTFRLYSNRSCTTQVDDIVRNDVSVEDGLFSVKLNVNQSDFSGQGLWLRVQVGGITAVDCEEIVPAPYALSLRPGAEIADTNTEVELNRYAYTVVPPIRLESKYGIRSQVTGGSYNYGYGVYGYSAAGNLGSYGVYGRSDSGYGGYFKGNTGITAEADGGGEAGHFIGDVNIEDALRVDGMAYFYGPVWFQQPVTFQKPIELNDEAVFWHNVEFRDDVGIHQQLRVAGSAEFQGSAEFRGPLTGSFPRPAWSSGWVSIPQSSWTTLTHNLGGDPDEYVVDMQCKADGWGINNRGVGGYPVDRLHREGASYSELTSSSVKVYRFSQDDLCSQVRIRIWAIR